ncbi:MAG: DUF4126 family protein [Anaerolineae bacterium]|jgi:uncharacterized membrane protein|nr:DUF4126 family protein [Anaerolineae bacterium]
MKRSYNIYLQTAKIGAVAGMRSMVAISLLSGHLAKIDPKTLQNTPLALLKTPTANTALKLAVVGEMLADKMPFTPARTAVLPLLWRVVWGALLGAVTTSGRRRSEALPGALVGGGAALFTSYFFYLLRVRGAERLHIPDALMGIAEDAAVLALGANVAQESE